MLKREVNDDASEATILKDPNDNRNVLVMKVLLKEFWKDAPPLLLTKEKCPLIKNGTTFLRLPA